MSTKDTTPQDAVTKLEAIVAADDADTKDAQDALDALVQAADALADPHAAAKPDKAAAGKAEAAKRFGTAA